MEFDARYKKLNTRQQQAVDTIDGPVMVVAGPGTGKTELLSMRAANILRQTDALPENILCLTFTDSGSVAMQKRLLDIIGRDAYNVSIYTFHSFGSDIMARYREYFYQGANFQPADEITRHGIITTILQSLAPSNPLKTMMNGEFTATGDIISAISDIKRSGLTADELTAILDANDAMLAAAEPILASVFAGRISKGTFDALSAAASQLAAIDEPQPVATLPRLSDVLRRSLQRALQAASEHPKITPPLTEWKKEWLTKNAAGDLVLKASQQQVKLRALVAIYRQYLAAMQAAELFDFDDMIAQVVHAIETIPELRFELQEKYHYIMVDEFQDTNLAQMRILHALTDNPANEGNPNLLVVGDDDQAIYGFQGADVGNILAFREHYPAAQLITLTDNYRSADCILESARQVITQGEERLERHIAELDKTLTPHAKSSGAQALIATLPTGAHERAWLAESIAAAIAAGTPPADIAVLARRHSDLIALLPHLAAHNIPVQYTHNDNVLEDEVVTQLLALARIVCAIATGQLDDTNVALPQLLAHPAWGIAPEILWKVSLTSYRNRQQWLEVLQTTPETSELASWLLACVQASQHQPLESMLDILLGEGEGIGNYQSPLKAYFFEQSHHERLAHLQNLVAIRSKLREWAPRITTPRLAHLLEFIDACEKARTTITSQRTVGQPDASVQLMSLHASKGLEFDTVYLLDASNANWAGKGRSSIISYPANLRLRRTTDSREEQLRLFFVGMTRAKRQLYISHAEQKDDGKELLPASFLAGIDSLTLATPHHTTPPDSETLIAQEWYAPIVTLPQATMRDQLADTLAHYKLSATHVNAFVDMTRGGPQAFLLHNLLHFPAAMGPHAAYGTAIHAALQFAHDETAAHHATPSMAAIIAQFKQVLQRSQLSPEDLTHFSQQGEASLSAFLAAKHASFTPSQRAELNFSHQQAMVGEAHLTGKLDVADINHTDKTITVTDYKTGGAVYDWNKGSGYQKIKAHKYRQQLLFYKLLVEHSREWRHYTFVDGVLQFVEPDKAGEIIDIRLGHVSPEEMADFTALLQAIWQHIQTLDFPDTSHYSPDYDGIIAFENDLRSGIL